MTQELPIISFLGQQDTLPELVYFHMQTNFASVPVLLDIVYELFFTEFKLITNKYSEAITTESS